MKKLISALCGVSLLATAVPFVAFAGDCYSQPVDKYSGTGTIKTAVFLRDNACQEGTSVVTTLPTGATVQVLGVNDGWHNVEWNGARGWIWQTFIENGANKLDSSMSYADYAAAYPSKGPSGSVAPSAPTVDPTLLGRVRGYILLQVQKAGEAWYVDPVSDDRYYMKDGPTAYQMMRSFGLGVSENDYEAMAAGDWTLKNRLRGRIVLRVHQRGEAYYIHPKDLKMYYLKDGEEAYRIMRLYSLGITDADLDQLSVSEIPVK